MSHRVDVRIDGPVTTVVLNEPSKRNALTVDLAAELKETIGNLVRNDRTRAVVVWGANGVFCSGGDLDQLEAMAAWDPGRIEAWSRDLYQSILRLRDVPVPTIAAVNGHAVGAGFGLALACDLRIAGEDAKFGATFLNVGLYPGMGMSYLLARAVGPARTLELFLTREILDAGAALRLGVVNRVVPAEQTLDEAQALAQTIAAGPPIPIRRLKHGVYEAMELELPAVLEREIRAQVACYKSEDLREGIRSVRERRRPRFVGR